MASAERLLRALQHGLRCAVDGEAEVAAGRRGQLEQLVRDGSRVQVRAPAHAALESALAQAAENLERQALVRQVELVVGEEETDDVEAALDGRLDGRLDLVQDGRRYAVCVDALQRGGGAVDALHRASDPRPHRKAVDGGVERVAGRRPREGESMRTIVARAAAPNDAGDSLEPRAGP